jgi:hypothetical protein
VECHLKKQVLDVHLHHKRVKRKEALFTNCIFGYSFFMSVLKQLAEYLYLKKPDPDRPKSQWIKYMHGINRISLLLFVVAIIILIIKLFFKK